MGAAAAVAGAVLLAILPEAQRLIAKRFRARHRTPLHHHAHANRTPHTARRPLFTFAESNGGVSIRTITASGCPNHYCVSLNPNDAAEQAVSQQVPASPVLRPSFGYNVAASDVSCVAGAVAYALNGVGIFNGLVNQQCDFVDVEDKTSEWTSFDCCGGHAAPGGNYHYHFPPSCLMDQIGPLADGHSPQIGWSLDGFPIYGE